MAQYRSSSVSWPQIYRQILSLHPRARQGRSLRHLAPIAVYFQIVCFPSAVLADYVEVIKTANIYSAPNSHSTPLQSVDPSTADRPVYFTVLDPTRTKGYYHIQIAAGQKGWIYTTRVRHFEGTMPGGSAAPTTDAAYGGIPDDSALHDKIKHLTNAGYVLGYSETKLNPLWVFFRVPTTDGAGGCPRLTRFLTDDRTDAQVTHTDYNNAGYDRGHMATSSTIGAAYGCEAQDETYFMSNITPQLPRLNQKAWGGFEDVIADVYARKFGTVWVVTGPIFDREYAQELCSGVEIPTAFYKIVVRELNGQPDALAIIMTQDTRPKTPIRDLVTTVDEIERDTGLDFFPNLPVGVQLTLEASRATDAGWKLNTQLDTSFPGTPRDLCVTERHKRSEGGVDQ